MTGPGSESSPSALWNRIAPLYDLQLFLERPSLRAAIELGAPLDGARVLDVGTGTGALLRELARSGARPAEAVGVDTSRAMLARARYAQLPPDWALEWADARALPFHDRHFDVVFATYLLNVLSDADCEVVLREARRVIRPDGRLVVVAWAAPRSALARPHRWLGRVLRQRCPSLVGRIRPVDPDALIRRGGFRPVRGRYVGRGYPTLCALAIPEATTTDQ